MPSDKDIYEQFLGFPFAPSRLENIDKAMLMYLQEQKFHVDTAKGSSPVPIVWTTSERSFQSKADSRIRDKEGSLILPIITAERTSVKKDLGKKGAIQAPHHTIFPDGKGGVLPVARRIKQDKSANFANAEAQKKRGQPNFPRKNGKVVYETLYIPMPVYVTVSYEVTLRTEYQQQMNNLMDFFMTSPGGVHYILINDDEYHRYEGFIQQDFNHRNNLSSLSTDEKKYETKISIEVLGHLYGGSGDTPNVSIRENAVDLKMPRERILTGDQVEREIGEYRGSLTLPDLPISITDLTDTEE